jgi:hypothetical protein
LAEGSAAATADGVAFGGFAEGVGAASGISTAIGISAAPQAEQATGGWATWFYYEQQMLRRQAEREALEQAVEAEIAARIEGEAVEPAEDAAPEYVDDLAALIAQAEANDAAFRRFVDALQLQALDELARLIAIDTAMRAELRRRRDEDDFIALLLLAA